MELIKIEKDVEKAKSLYNLAVLRYNKISSFNIEIEASLIVESYYEIIKELITAILFIDGYKTLSHKDLVTYIKINYSGIINNDEIEIIDLLRKRRNGIVYYGIMINPFFVNNNKETIEIIIQKLKDIIK